MASKLRWCGCKGKSSTPQNRAAKELLPDAVSKVKLPARQYSKPRARDESRRKVNATT